MMSWNGLSLGAPRIDSTNAWPKLEEPWKLTGATSSAGLSAVRFRGAPPPAGTRKRSVFRVRNGGSVEFAAKTIRLPSAVKRGEPGAAGRSVMRSASLPSSRRR